MSAAAKTNEAFANETPVELVELQRAIDSLPITERVKLVPVFQNVIESTNRRRKILNLVQEALGQLRLDMKYLVFDLEATRRERDSYREQLQSFNFEDDANEKRDDEDMF
jgi:hypothetical protein